VAVHVIVECRVWGSVWSSVERCRVVFVVAVFGGYCLVVLIRSQWMQLPRLPKSSRP